MDSNDEIIAGRKQEYEAHAALFAHLPGAEGLIAANDGWAPTFHDATIEEIKLLSRGQSILQIRNPFPDIFSGGRAIVTFTFGEVVDLELSHFIRDTNILFRVLLRPAMQRPDRRGYHRALRPDDIEIELEPTAGLGGYLVCADVSVSWALDTADQLTQPC